MKKYLLILSLLLSNPCLMLYAADGNFVQKNKVQVVQGDTLSEIAETLIPNNKALRGYFMEEVVRLNPGTFPTKQTDFMLSDQVIILPSEFAGIRVKSSLRNSDSKYLPPQELLIQHKPLKTTPTRIFSISNEGIEAEFSSGETAKSQTQYIIQGENQAQIVIENGPLILLKSNTKIKVYLDKGCYIHLFYGSIEVQERSYLSRHCRISTKLIEIYATNSNFGVQVCHETECIVEDNLITKTVLPPGVYYGVLKGSVNATDKNRTTLATKDKFYYYAPKASTPTQIEPFEGLIFSPKEIKKIAPMQEKQKFPWGYINTNTS